MKKPIIYLTAIILFVNLLMGLLLSSYEVFNICLTSVTILITGILLVILHSINLKDAYAISLSTFFIVIGIIEFILAIISPQHISDNGYVISCIILYVVQVIILLICKQISKQVS